MSKPFIHDDFLLQTDTALRLFHEYAETQPILDYHNHLPPQDIAENRQFNDLFEIWLEGDHYKWRAMRANGIDESLVTGDADPYEKFLAFARMDADDAKSEFYPLYVPRAPMAPDIQLPPGYDPRPPPPEENAQGFGGGSPAELAGENWAGAD